jgi:hypothetical protein
MQVYIWIKEDDIFKINSLIKDQSIELDRKDQIKVFNEKVLPNSILVSLSLDEYVNLDDRELIRKIY